MIRTIVAMLALLGASGMASAQTPARVMTGYAATSGPHAVLWIAREAGLFDKNGIKAEVAYIRSGSTMAQTLVSGEIQLSQMGGPAMLSAGVAGMDVTFVAVALNTTPIVIMGNVAKMEDLKGKAMGVTRYGSNTDTSARYAIRKAGLATGKRCRAGPARRVCQYYLAAFRPAELPPAPSPIRLPTRQKSSA